MKHVLMFIKKKTDETGSDVFKRKKKEMREENSNTPKEFFTNN